MNLCNHELPVVDVVCFVHSSSAYTSVYTEQVGDHLVYALAGAEYVSHTR